MKNMIRIVAIIGLLSLSMLAYSGEIIDIYNPGDTLTAITLDNIKGAVNDNDGRITALEAAYTIGDIGPAGGWVFYVDADGRHGLEAAPMDQNTGIRWNNGMVTSTNTRTLVGAQGDGVGAGEMNTMLIVASQGFFLNTYASGICANLVITNANAGVDYGDWYLPSKYELNLMYRNIGQGSAPIVNVGGFAGFNYWSSSEVDSYLVGGQNFSDGSQNDYGKGLTNRVRAVRAF